MRRNLLFMVVAVTLFMAAMFAHGFLPGQSGNARARVMVYGAFECGSYATEEMLRQKCDLIGGDAGGIYPTGYPFMLAGALVKKTAPTISNESIYVLLTSIIVATSLTFGYRLGRTVGLGRWSSLAVISLYILSPIVLSMGSFGGTLWGAILLPVWIYLPLSFLLKINKQDRPGWAQWLKLILVFIAVSIIALFTDGYTYFMSQFAVAIFGTVLLISEYTSRRIYLIAIIFLISNVVAYLTYTALTPVSGTLDTSSIDFFRAMGADIASFFNPSWRMAISTLINPFDTTVLWGDGTNNSSNYVSVVLISVLLALFVERLVKRERSVTYIPADSRRFLRIALMIIMVTSFVLSIGPSIKIWNTKGFDDSPVTMKSYTMSKEHASHTLPTEYLYTNIPGLKSMRAIYRWHLLTYLMLLLVVFLYIERLGKTRSVAAVIISCLIICEMMLNVATIYNRNVRNHVKIEQFNEKVVDVMRRHVEQNDRLIFYPNNGNDFLVNYIAPSLKAFTYNVGNDKARVNAEKQWPHDVRLVFGVKDIEGYSDVRQPVIDMLKQGAIDKVIVPKFDTRSGLDSWPIDLTSQSRSATQFIKVMRGGGEGDNLMISEEDYFYIIQNSPQQ